MKIGLFPVCNHYIKKNERKKSVPQKERERETEAERECERGGYIKSESEYDFFKIRQIEGINIPFRSKETPELGLKYIGQKHFSTIR